jgi:siroheme synthase
MTRLNSDAKMVRAGINKQAVAECKRALQQIRLAGGPPMIETRQGTTIRNYPKDKILETIRRIG